MRHDPPLLEHTGSSRGESGATVEATGSDPSPAVPYRDSLAITIHTGDGSRTITADELLVYASLVQTLLLLALTYQQIKS